MTPLGEILPYEIRRGNPIPFSRFMEASLYHPEHGYYRRAREPFGRRASFGPVPQRRERCP
jgi:SAM-dependent MidA family methyltransferase